MKLRVKRIYESPSAEDGRRILVDGVWPRGLSRDKARVDYWARDIAPSARLRQWYKHDADKWEEFQRRYFEELDANAEAVAELRRQLDEEGTTLLFSSKEERFNNAWALKAYLEE